MKFTKDFLGINHAGMLFFKAFPDVPKGKNEFCLIPDQGAGTKAGITL